MRKFIYYLLTFCCFQASAFASSESLYSLGLKASLAKETDAAVKSFEQIDPQSSDFVPALLELQRIFYTRGEWEKFFGYAAFYRHRYLNPVLEYKRSPKEKEFYSHYKKTFREEVIALEVLALLQFCKWEVATAVFTTGKALAFELQSKDQSTFKQIGSLLDVLQVYTQVKNTKRDAKVPGSLFNTTQYWEFPSNLMSLVSHPRYMRVKLESACSHAGGSDEK